MLQLDQLRHDRRLALPAEPRRHGPRHHRDQPSRRLRRGRVHPRGGKSCCRAPTPVVTLAEGGTHPGPLMRHSLPQSHQFYVTAPQPCPYLPGKVERKLFTALQGDGACHLNDVLSHQGFRRSQNVLYRPSCAGCSACLSARIVVARLPAEPRPAARAAAQRRARAGRRAAPGPPRRSTPCSAATSTRATPPAAWPTWT